MPNEVCFANEGMKRCAVKPPSVRANCGKNLTSGINKVPSAQTPEASLGTGNYGERDGFGKGKCMKKERRGDALRVCISNL